MDEQSVLTPLGWTSDRRYGVEMELNAFDGRNRPEKKDDLPKGIETVGDVVECTILEPVSVMHWHHTHNNENWVIKPDSSCGMEVCSPILKGWKGLENVVRVSHAFQDHDKIESDKRCSLHVHVNVHDCSLAEVASMVAHWIKCEPVFIDSVPANRKRSRYCQVVGMSDMFDHRDGWHPKTIIDKMGASKYFSINNFHFSKDKRASIEFRIAENDACTDPFFVKNWVRLVVHFCDMAKLRSLPRKYVEGDPRTGLCWLDPLDVFAFLGFLPGQYNLSPGLQQTRDWFLARLLLNTRHSGLKGVFSDLGRSYAWRETQEIARLCQFAKSGDEYQVTDLFHCLHPTDLKKALYDKNLRV